MSGGRAFSAPLGAAALFVGRVVPAIPALRAEPLRPVEAARSCPRHGPGFVELPGTTTCVRIGGRVTAEYGAASRRVSREPVQGFGSSARVSVDARTDTPYGPVRSFVRVRAGQGILARDRPGTTAFITVPMPGDH